MAITPAKITSRSSERNSLHRSPDSEPATRVEEMSSIILMSLSSSGAMPTNLSLFINRHLTAPYSRLTGKILRRLRLVNEGVFGRRIDCGLRLATEPQSHREGEEKILTRKTLFSFCSVSLCLCG